MLSVKWNIKMDRVMDLQQDCVERLNSLYKNVKKLGTDRRDQKNLVYQNEQRLSIWKHIEVYHEQLTQHGAPAGYEEKYKDAQIINKKILEKLIEFGLQSDSAVEAFDTPTIFAPKDETVRQSNTEKRVDNSEFMNITMQQTLTNILQQLADNQAGMQRNISQVPQLKPQKIKIATFKGDISQYLYFKEATHRVLNNVQWGNIEKFVFLKEHLEDDPLKMINVLQMDTNAYNQAWEILDKFYDSQRRLLSRNIKLITIETFSTKEKDINSLKEFKYTFEAVKANFKQMQVTADQILAELTISRFDNLTAERFEDYIGYSNKTPSLDQISDFLIKEELQRSNLFQHGTGSKSLQLNVKSKPMQVSRAHVTHDEKVVVCFICKKDHTVIQCPAFITAPDKIEFMRFYKLCIFCGKHRYDRRNHCKAREYLKCQTCNGKHLSELHPNKSSYQFEAKSCKNSDLSINQPALPSSERTITPNSVSIPDLNENKNNINTLVTHQNVKDYSLMPTIIANIYLNERQTIPVRCLVDQCAERSYVSEKLAKVLGLKRQKTNEIIKGINNVTTFATHFVQIRIKFNDNSLEDLKLNALVLPQITGKIPRCKVPTEIINLNLQLADPGFGDPDNVEILLGNDVTHRIFKNNEPIKISEAGLIYQSTHFGWIISGNTCSSTKRNKDISTFVTLSETNQKLSRDIELSQQLTEFYSLPEKNDEDQNANKYCDDLFESAHYRLPNGRYVVPIPWIPNAPELGKSYNIARACFMNQEKKWLQDPILHNTSNEFMTEYYKMGHMVNVPEENQRLIASPKVCYIPYISIARKDAYTTKLRNVFNASSKTDNGVTLNDTMFEGKKLQNKIFDIVTKCRTFKYMYGADIVKMFRQIMILPQDRERLRILWRHDQQVPLNEFHLATVTYGTNAAPWQAIRTIHQCAEDNAPSQQICNIIKSSFYVDDLLYGADTMSEAKLQIKDIISTMKSGQFPLTKWLSNNESILDEIPTDKRLSAYVANNGDAIKLLGLIYDHATDCFRININVPGEIEYSKRSIASVAASFYDPLGLILPFVMLLRIFLRNVWAEHVDWDEKLNDDLIIQFKKQISNAEMIKSIRIPRWIGTQTGDHIELIGFSDASNDAQAAIIYSRTKINEKYIINIIAAKGNVTKLKTKEIINSKQQTIPKLELEAIVTLATLYESVKKCMSHLEISFTAYTDSQIALAWIRNNNVQQKVIRRKINKIKNIIEPGQLHYVSSSDNPADPASRGLTANKLAECNLYYNGPAWLQDEVLPVYNSHNDTRYDNLKCLISKNIEKYDMFEQFSNLRLLVKITALIVRWKKYKRNSPISCFTRYIKSSDGKLYFQYNADEIEYARQCIIKYYQHSYLGDIIQNLQNNCNIPVKKGHWLYKLSPYLDENGIIRVGGRLNYAEIPENLKHPIVIPESNLKKLIIKDAHCNNMHASNSLMLRLINENYWIPALRSSIHHFNNKCVTCVRWKNKRIQPQMSQLPKVRVNQALPFENVGVDLAGPFQIKSGQHRKSQIIKVWIVTFICMLTKAIHLEITSSCDTEHFLGAFDRFSSRRGIPKQVWSDNGKNFIGANRMLIDCWKKISTEVQSQMAIREIKWVFIPRYSPSFGGLWEASVKSIKYFTKRMNDVKNLSFEEFSTLLCKVEALLNSRPITENPISPFEEPPLTPFHFLTGQGVTNNSITVKGLHQSPLKKKWLEILQIQLQLWKRFQKEYLHQMQKKTKWVRKDKELNNGELVLLDDRNTLPGEWKKGKVVKTYKDHQGVARRADVQYADGKVFTESIKNLIPLNILNYDELPLRSTNRLRNISATQVLLLWLSFSSGISANNVTTLDAGVHVLQLDDVYLRAGTLEFTLDTGLNISNDIQTIENHINEFHEFCVEMINIPSVESYCKSLETTIKFDAKEVIMFITESFNISTHRNKRLIPVAKIGIQQVSKFALKHSPEILLSAGMIYQGYEIHELQQQEEKYQIALQKITKAIDTQEKDLENNLKSQRKAQMELTLIQSIDSITNVFTTIINSIKDKYNRMLHIRPIEELRTYFNRFQNQSLYKDLLILDNINTFKDVVRRINSEVIILTYQIPLVQNHKFQQYAIISVPSSSDEIIKFPYQNKVMKFILSKDQSEYAEINEQNLESCETHKWIPLSQCMKYILQNDIIETNNECKYVKDITTAEIIKINREWTVVFNKKSITTVICGNNTQYYNQSTLLIKLLPNCIIDIGNTKLGELSGNTVLEKMENLPNITIPIVKPAKISIHKKPIESLKGLTENQSFQSQKIKTSAWYLGTGLILSLLTVTILCIYYQRKNKKDQKWFPKYIGPMIGPQNFTLADMV